MSSCNREEPLIYINGSPYVLRQQAISLRNVKSYASISTSRLELLEERLRSDILAEARAFDGRLLLHTESSDGTVFPIWETITSPSGVKTLKEVMLDVSKKMGIADDRLMYRRIPITAERAPDFSDVRDIVEIVATIDLDQAIVVNCQLGSFSVWLLCLACLLIRVSQNRSRKKYSCACAHFTCSALVAIEDGSHNTIHL